MAVTARRIHPIMTATNTVSHARLAFKQVAESGTSTRSQHEARFDRRTNGTSAAQGR